MTEKISNVEKNKITGLTVKGFINLSSPKKAKKFQPHFGGFRLSEVPVKKLA